VADALGITLDEYADALRIESLRGRLLDIESLGKLLERFAPGRLTLIVIDAFCAFMLIHHATKGNQAGKSTTDIGAGAGSQSRATDTHLVLRPHAEPDAVILEAATRSWPPLEPVCLRWRFPLWHPDQQLDAKAPRKPTARADAAEKFDAFLARVEEVLGEKGPLTKSRLREELGTSGAKINAAIEALLERERIEEQEILLRTGAHRAYCIEGAGQPGNSGLLSEPSNLDGQPAL
jgi:hypothetical protein